MIYPQKLSSKNGEMITRGLVIFSIILMIIMIIINKITTPAIPWAAIANCGIIYAWLTVIYSIKRSSNIAGHVLLQIIIISMATLYIDNKIGFSGWSINIAVPIILIVANVIMLILTIISYRKYIKYAIYQLTIVLISICSFSFIAKGVIEIEILWKITNGISILNLLITIILCYKDIKEAITRNIHT